MCLMIMDLSKVVIIGGAIALSVAVGFSQSAEPRKLSLKECEELAFERHLQLKDARLRLKAAEAKKIQASHAGILPRLRFRNIWGPINKLEGVETEDGVITSDREEFESFSDMSFFTQFEINFVQPLYTFGKISGLKDAAHFNVEVEEANIERKQRDVQTQVRELYWGMLLGEELLFVIKDAQKEVAKANEKIQEKLDQGSEEVSRSDLFKLQIFSYEIDKQLREIVAKSNLAKSSLALMLSLTKNQPVLLAEEYLEPVKIALDTIATYFELAGKKRAEILQLQAGLKVGRSLIRSEKSEYYPQFYLAGEAKYNYAKDRFDPKNPFLWNPTNYFRTGVIVGANLNMNFMQTKDKLRVAEIEFKRLAEKESFLADGIRLEIEKAYAEVLQAETNMRGSRKAKRASNSWLNSASMTFDIGVGEIKDLIEAHKAHSKMQSEHFLNIYAFNVAVAKLSKATGADLLAQEIAQ